MSEPARKGEPFTLAWTIPEEQRLTYKITPDKPGLFSARSIGGQLTALAKLLESEANKDDPKLKWLVALTAAYTHADGSISFDIMLTPKSTAVSRPSGETP